MENDADSDGELPFPIYHEGAAGPGTAAVELTATSWDDLAALKAFEKAISSHNIAPASLLPPPIESMSPPLFAPCLVNDVPIADLLASSSSSDIDVDYDDDDDAGDGEGQFEDPDDMPLSWQPQEGDGGMSTLPRPPDSSAGIPGAWTSAPASASEAGGARMYAAGGGSRMDGSVAMSGVESSWTPGELGLPPWAVHQGDEDAMDAVKSWAEEESDVKDMMRAEYDRGMVEGQKAEKEMTFDKRAKKEEAPAV